MPVVIINRSDQLTNYLRKYKVFIDDKLMGSVKNNETARYYIEPGEHKLQLRIEWVGSPVIEFTAEKDEIRTFRVAALEYGRILNLFMAGMITYFFFFPPTFFQVPDYFLMSLLVCAILLIIYQTTLGRNQFLTLNEVEADPEIRFTEQSATN